MKKKMKRSDRIVIAIICILFVGFILKNIPCLLNKNNIVFVRYEIAPSDSEMQETSDNLMWGKICQGYYVNAKGEVKEFSFTNEENQYADIEVLLERLKSEKLEPSGYVDVDELKQCHNQLFRIGLKKEIQNIFVSKQQGENAAYGISYDALGGKRIHALYTEGIDNCRYINLDDKAQEARNSFSQMMEAYWDSRNESRIIPQDDDIIFVKQYKNWASGFQHICYYINAKGEVRWLELSERDEKYCNIHYLIEYLKNRKGIEPIGYIDKQEIDQYYQMYLGVNPDSELELIPRGNDMGDDNFYGIEYNADGESNFQLLYSDGDTEIINTDKDAQIVADWLDNKISNVSEEAKGKGRKITDNDILFIKRLISEKNINQGYYVKGNGEILVYEFETEEDILSIKKLYSYLQEHDSGTVVESVPREELEEKYHTLFSTNEPIEEIYKRAGRGKEILYGIGYGVFDNWSVWMLADEENGEIDIADSNAVECVEWLEDIFASLEE